VKKTLFTLCVDGYAPEITALTFPLMRRYADKIGADFHVITERKFPDYPPVFEKLQIHTLGRDMGNDWNIYVDADALIHPDLFDFTEHLSKDTVFHNGSDPASIRWRFDDYFRRDGRNIGSCNWFTAASDWCLDLWRPPEEPLEDLVANISLIRQEVESGVMRPSHLIDDYVLSRNIARFGLKFETMRSMMTRLHMNPDASFLHHTYTDTHEKKAEGLLKVLEAWKLLDLSKESLTFV
jgi:hypothetical protein